MGATATRFNTCQSQNAGWKCCVTCWELLHVLSFFFIKQDKFSQRILFCTFHVHALARSLPSFANSTVTL